MIGVIADDITGANDIGIMFAKHGLLTHVYAWDEFSPARLTGQPDVVVLDTASRLDDPETAYRKVAEAAGMLRKAGVTRFVNKTCSVFRGNIGPQFDATLDVLEEDFAVVVLGFPKNGRTTVEGIHYVHGKRLEDSEFRHDPVHPMTRSRLADILQGQTRRAVDELHYPLIDQGAEALRAHIEEKKKTCQYLIVDIRDQQDLRTVAEALRDATVLGGSSALAEEWGPLVAAPHADQGQADIPSPEGVGMLCAAGSLMPQTASQIEHMRLRAAPVLELRSRLLLDDAEREQEAARVADAAVDAMMQGKDTVVHATLDPAAIQETKEAGKRMGWTNEQVSRRVSDAIADVTSRVLARTGQRKLVVAGGETSAAVCAKLGITGMRVWEEIEPGLPSCISLGETPMMLVLKSGSFGKSEFFETAMHHLRNQ